MGKMLQLSSLPHVVQCSGRMIWEECHGDPKGPSPCQSLLTAPTSSSPHPVSSLSEKSLTSRKEVLISRELRREEKEQRCSE